MFENCNKNDESVKFLYMDHSVKSGENCISSSTDQEIFHLLSLKVSCG